MMVRGRHVDVWQFFKAAHTFVGVAPAPGDSLLRLAVKGAAAVDLIRLAVEGDVSERDRFAKRLGLKRRRSRQLVHLFFETPLGASFAQKRIKLSATTTLLQLQRDDVGVLYFVELSGGGSEYAPEFYYEERADLGAVLKALWGHYDHRIHVRIGEDGSLSYSGFPVVGDAMFGSAPKRLERFIAKHRKLHADGIARSYLFVGPAGVGKSTFALAAAAAIGTRILRLDATSLTRFEAREMEFLLGALKPDVLIVDDIDKGPGVERYSDNHVQPASIYHILEWIKIDHAGVPLLLTSNTVDGLPPAMIRPGRVDEPLVFKLPTKAERLAILKGYVEALLPKDRRPTVKQLDVLATRTELLAGAWLREVALQLRYSSVREVSKTITDMKAVLETPKSRRFRGRRRKKKAKTVAVAPSNGQPKGTTAVEGVSSK